MVPATATTRQWFRSPGTGKELRVLVALKRIAVACCLTQVAVAGNVGDLSYRDNGTTMTITACAKTVEGQVVIPETIDDKPVTEIPNGAFTGCTKVASIVLPSGVTTLGSVVFGECIGLVSVSVGERNAKFSAEDGVLCNKDRTKLILCPRGKNGAFVIPASVTEVADGAFSYCRALTGIEIPAGVGVLGAFAFRGCTGLTAAAIPPAATKIGQGLFEGCSGLTNVTIGAGAPCVGDSMFSGCRSLTTVAIPASVTSIGEAAFQSGCGITSITVDPANPNYCSEDGVLFSKSRLALVQYPGARSGDYTIPDQITIVADHAFNGCAGLTAVTIPPQVKHIGKFAFCHAKALKTVQLPSGLTEIGPNAFDDCSALTSMAIPAGVTILGKYAFNRCEALADVTIPASVTDIGDYAFGGCGKLKHVALPEGITCVAGGTFWQCVQLESVTIPNGVTSIGPNAFSGCRGLRFVTLPRSVTAIGKSAFEFCVSLESIAIPDGVTKIEDETFCRCDLLAEIRIPEGVTSIGRSAFSGCNMTNVTIPKSVTNIADNAFMDCQKLVERPIAAGNDRFVDCDGVLFDKSRSILCNYPAGRSGTSYEIPSGVTMIAGFAFFNCRSLQNIVIPTSVTSIGYNAFTDCAGLSGLTIPSSVKSIGAVAFAGCDNLTYVKIGAAVTSIGPQTFYGCGNLKSVLFMGDAPTVDASAFASGSGTLKVFFYAGKQGFTAPRWHGLPTVETDPSRLPVLTATGTGQVTATAATLKSTVNANGVTAWAKIEYGTTAACDLSIPVRLQSEDGSLSEQIAADLHDLVPATTYFYRFAATNLNGSATTERLTFKTREPFSYTMADGMATITGYDWTGGEMRIPAAIDGFPVAAIGNRAFAGNPSISTVVIGDGVKSIGDDAFRSCRKLTQIGIPPSVGGIGSGVFDGCVNLTRIAVDPANQFYSSVDGVLFDKGMTVLVRCPEGRAGNCVVPASVSEITGSAFKNCRLDHITIEH